MQKRSSLGFDARGSPSRMKQSGLENSKERFHEKREFVETRENGVKSLAKNRVRFRTEKSCQLFYLYSGLEHEPCLCFLRSCKIQDRVKGGGGGAGKRAGLRNRAS